MTAPAAWSEVTLGERDVDSFRAKLLTSRIEVLSPAKIIVRLTISPSGWRFILALGLAGGLYDSGVRDRSILRSSRVRGVGDLLAVAVELDRELGNVAKPGIRVVVFREEVEVERARSSSRAFRSSPS